MEEFFKQNSVKLRMMTSALNSAFHNSSSKGQKTPYWNKCDVWLTAPAVFNLSISLLLWKDKINTDINASVEILV